MRTLWLADHLLVSERGHHVSYNGFIADSAKRAGMAVRILCARECDAEVPGGFPMHRIFRKDWRNSPWPLLTRSRRALDALEIVARRRFEADLRNNIGRQNVARDDIIFAEMLAPRNLVAWLRWFDCFPIQSQPTLVLHVGYASERFGANKEIPVLLRQLEQSGKLSRAHFATDSPMLKEKYEAIFRRPVTHLPLVISRHASECYKPPGTSPHFVCLGNAREEKGYVEILAAVDILHANGNPPDARFTLQSSYPDAASTTALAAFRSAKAKSVSLIHQPLDDQSYLRLLTDADVVLVPYYLNRYHDRTSGVFCEAMTAGKPVIATEHSFLGLEVAKQGIGWLVPDRDPASMARVIRRAIDELNTVAARCAELMPHYKLLFHPDTFVSQLLTLADEKK
ncbi:MAG TPA: glycosyltransferase [Terrimicrobiaceae bacterium]